MRFVMRTFLKIQARIFALHAPPTNPLKCRSTVARAEIRADRKRQADLAECGRSGLSSRANLLALCIA
jgi:hypothetical protein